MKRTHQTWKSFLALLCVILILAYISVAFFPHAHSTCDTDCALCELLRSAREMLGVLAFCAVVYRLSVGCLLPFAQERILPTCNRTLVGLKVKLSD